MTPQTQPQTNPIKQYLDPYGEIRLNCVDRLGHTLRARTNSVKGLLAIIAEWRRLGFKHIEVWEPPRYGVTQLWDVQETKVGFGIRLSVLVLGKQLNASALGYVFV
jgi:hypothetical protein